MVHAAKAKFYKEPPAYVRQDSDFLSQINVSTAQLSMPILFLDIVWSVQLEKSGKDQVVTARTEKLTKGEFAFLNANPINLLISMETATIVESMNTQKEELVCAMTDSPRIHPVRFANSDVHPTNSLSTVFAESAWWALSTTISSKPVSAKMDGTKTFTVLARKKMERFVTQDSI